MDRFVIHKVDATGKVRESRHFATADAAYQWYAMADKNAWVGVFRVAS